MLNNLLIASGIYFIFDGIKDFFSSIDFSSLDIYSIIDVCRVPIGLILIAVIFSSFKSVDNFLK